jgi:HYDIN/CFA65/VesB family protein
MSGLRRSVQTCLWVVALGCCGAGAAQAQGSGPGYHVSAGPDLNCGGAGQTLSSSTPPVVVGPVQSPCTSGTHTGTARAGAGPLGASSSSEHHCCGTASGGGGSVRVQVDNVVITGPPAASVPISMTAHLKGTLNGSTDFGQAGIWVFARLGGFNTNLSTISEIALNPSGVFTKSGVFALLDVSFPSATIDQDFVMFSGNGAPNQPLSLEIQMLSSSAMAGNGVTSSDFFTGPNGFSFPVGIPVFDLPDGYTVNIPELNIVDNRWQGAVPPNVSVSPLTANLGSVPIGSQSTTVITVTNTGGPGLVLNSVSFAAGSPAFSILSIARGSAGVALPVTLATNDTVDIETAFTPTAAGTVQRALNVTTSDGDTPLVTIPVLGEGVQLQVPPSQQIDRILTFFDTSAAAGTLDGAGAGNSADGRLKALRNMIEAAGDFIDDGDTGAACDQLRNVLNRIDGNPRPPDFVIGAAGPELRSRALALRTELGCVP